MPSVAVFRCKVCNAPLFLEEQVIVHEPGKAVAFRKGNRADAGCSSYFLPKFSWMGELSGNEGNLGCPKCSSRIGGYKWSGRPCTCGQLVVPYIAVHRNKVDRIEVAEPVGTRCSDAGDDAPRTTSAQ